jgi:digeranylgeranylglycerophospholipid reductase
MKGEYDAIVVGAGPAGSIAARTAAEHGLDVLLIEKRQEIGDPVRCAEGVPRERLEEFIEPDIRWICAEISGARVFAPDGSVFKLAENRTIGYILERKLFDRALARSAAMTGAEVQVKTQATSLIVENGLVCGIKGKHCGDDFEARARVVVGADGIESRVGRWAGIDTTLKLKDVDSCAQFLVTDIDIDPSCCDFYPGNAVAPGGYAWVFPKGKREANVGLGILGTRIRDKHPVDYLREFIGRQFPDGKVIESVAGAVSACNVLPCISTGGLVLVGDAGRLSDPLTGGGIVNGMESGRIAGNVVAKAIRSRDVSSTALMRYDREIYASLGRMIERNYRIKEKVVTISDESINKMIRYCSPFSTTVPPSVVLKELHGQGHPLLRRLLKPLFHMFSSG